MFALLIPTRPILPQPTATLSQTQCSFTFPASPSFTHLALFLHPGQILPPDTLAATYIQIPPSPDFKLLGALGNDKQSALFRVNAGKGSSRGSADDGALREEIMVDDTAEDATQATAEVVVGISIEPAAQVQVQLEAKAAQARQTSGASTQASSAGGVQLDGDAVKKLAQRIGQNAFNYLTSFADNVGGREVFPIKAFQDWWTKFEKKVQLEPGFLLKDGDG